MAFRILFLCTRMITGPPKKAGPCERHRRKEKAELTGPWAAPKGFQTALRMMDVRQQVSAGSRTQRTIFRTILRQRYNWIWRNVKSRLWPIILEKLKLGDHEDPIYRLEWSFIMSEINMPIGPIYKFLMIARKGEESRKPLMLIFENWRNNAVCRES